MNSNHSYGPRTDLAVRTLIAAGYSIEGCHRQPGHLEIRCSRVDTFGSQIRYMVCLTTNDDMPDDVMEDVARTAEGLGRVWVMIAPNPGTGRISWDDFAEALGGIVPSWQALTSEFQGDMLTASKNELPPGASGEAWLVFEDMVCYGLEFILGRRVRRLGGRRRGRRVSDMQAQTPQGHILVVDTKASKIGFDSKWDELRPLIEYVNRQKIRQQGQLDLIGAAIISSGFLQNERTLLTLSQQFFGETRVPLSFMTAGSLAEAVGLFRERPDARNGIRWNQIFTGGLLGVQSIKKELCALDMERVKKEA